MTGLFALIFGFLIGTVCPQDKLPWGVEEVREIVAEDRLTIEIPTPIGSQDGPEGIVSPPTVSKGDESVQNSKAPEEAVFNPKENLPLLSAACSVLSAIQERDYSTLAGYVDQERGLTITPYSTVSEADLTFEPLQVKKFADNDEKYVWGMVPGSGELIQMTVEEFISGYIFNVDYTQAPKIAIDKINISGNALENVTEAYPDCRFVEFTFPGLDASYEGLDWCSLKAVFVPAQSKWMLVGLIHSQWTV